MEEIRVNRENKTPFPLERIEELSQMMGGSGSIS